MTVSATNSSNRLGQLFGGDAFLAAPALRALRTVTTVVTAVQRGESERQPEGIARSPQQQARVQELRDKIASMKAGQILSVAEARELARLTGINTARPMYIGGGGEEGSGLSAPNVQNYAQDRGNFAAWTQGARIRDYVEIARALRQPVVLIGHSYGGDAAFDAALYADRRGIDVNLLVTIDPVDGSHDHTRQEAMTLNRNLGGLWVNVQATRYLANPNFSDRVASVGGRMSDGAQGQADVYLRRDVNHEQFVAMLREAQVEQMVAGTYANATPR